MIKSFFTLPSSWKQVVDIANVVRNVVDSFVGFFMLKERTNEEAAVIDQEQIVRKTSDGLWLLDVVKLVGLNAAMLKITKEMRKKKRRKSPKDSSQDWVLSR